MNAFGLLIIGIIEVFLGLINLVIAMRSFSVLLFVLAIIFMLFGFLFINRWESYNRDDK